MNKGNTYEHGLTTNMLKARVMKHPDNTYNSEVIKNVIEMYTDEIRNGLLNGEKINLPEIGTLQPKITQPRAHYYYDNEDTINLPHVNVKYRLNNKFRKKMNAKLRRNIRDGKLELSEGKPEVRFIECDWTEEYRKALLDGKATPIEDEE